MHRTRIAGLALLFLMSCSACDQGPAPAKEAISFTEVDPLLKAHDVEAAQRLLEQLLERHGPDARIVVRLSRVLRAQGDASRAVAELKRCVAKTPAAGSAWLELGEIYGEIGLYPLCREAYEKARAGGMQDQDVALPLGACLGRLGEADLAQTEFDRALAAGVPQKLILYNKAVGSYDKKDWVHARQWLEQALALDPAWAEVKRELARVLILGNSGDRTGLERAMSLLWDAKDALAEDTHLYEVMGDGWMLMEDWDAAVDAYTNALKFGQNPKHVEAKYVEARKRQKAAQEAGAAPPPR